MVKEVLTKGPILDWTSDRNLHERFLEWKKAVSVLCKGLKMTNADPEFTCLCIYQWSGERGQNIFDKATFVRADLKKWEKHLEKLEKHSKPRGSKLVAATQYKVLTQRDLQQTGSSRLPPTSTIAVVKVKDRLCRLSAQHRQQPQPYDKGQMRFTRYKKSTEKMENQDERDTTKMTRPNTRLHGMKRQDCYC